MSTATAPIVLTAPTVSTVAPATDEAPRYRVSVRALCEFTAKVGDLDLRFTPTPTAQEGIAGHAIVAARRGEHYQTEVALAAEHGALLVRGRADGYDPQQHLLEEVKTYRGQLSRACSHAICEMRWPQKAGWQGARQGWWWCHQP